jgi:hypothetical protein
MEVLISVMILAVAMVVLIDSIRASISTVQLSRERTKAAYLAQLKMWEMEDLLYWESEVGGYDSQGYFDNPNAMYEWDIDVRSDEDLSEHVVTVRITWEHGRDNEKSYELVTVIPMDRDPEKYLK